MLCVWENTQGIVNQEVRESDGTVNSNLHYQQLEIHSKDNQEWHRFDKDSTFPW